MNSEKGGRGTLTILKNTQLLHPVNLGMVTDVLAGRELPIVTWRRENSFIVFTLDDEQIEGCNTWQILSSACDFNRANPEVKADKIIGKVDVVELPRIGRVDLKDSIIPKGHFTWGEATHSGTRLPPNQEVFDNILRIGRLAEEARERLGKPMTVTSWHRTRQANQACGGAKNSRHLYGDALDFTVEGMNGHQLYNLLDPWWPGGLGMYPWFPQLCHIDARGYRARWGAE